MKRLFILGPLVMMAAVWCSLSVDAWARGGLGGVGGGGGRAGGGGGGRPSGGGMSRPSGGSRPSPSRPSPSRPSPSRPSGGSSRPSISNASRPSMPSRPTMPSSRPSTPSRPPGGNLGGYSPSGGRPATRPSTPQFPRPSNPGIAQRPTVNSPGNLRPATRPSFPGGSGGGINRPDIGAVTRPGQGGAGIQLPSRPGQGAGGIQTLPARPDRPSLGDLTRPGQGGGGTQFPNRPDFPNRPGTLPDRPNIGPDRPGRPDRPIIGGGGNNIVNRPGDNIHIGDNNLNINRPGWGLNRPGGNWWSQNNNWADHWHNNCINNHHHNWYHGCWSGHWGTGWYAPFVVGAVGWGSWGYGPTYSNPYYVASAEPAYDYSQPVVVNNYVSSDATGGEAQTPATQQNSPENDQAMKLFDDGMAAFKTGGYAQALAKMEAALKLMPNDPVLHEVRALTLFALGRYQDSAATLNALLATSPGMDWTSMSSLYGNVDDYTRQLRVLEAHIKANRSDAPAIFVLAYHYLVIGQNEQAVKALREVVRLQPKDATAQRMLTSLAPPEETPAASPPPPADAPTSEAPATDLVGTWRATSGDTVIELTIDEQSNFSWRATPKGKPTVEVKGTADASSDALALASKDQGNMVGQVKSGGADHFTFTMQGTPPGDPGLAFSRAK